MVERELVEYGRGSGKNFKKIVELEKDNASLTKALEEEIRERNTMQKEISELKEEVDELKELQSRSISWSVDDFSGRAEQREGTEYDENKFEEALERMISKHDAELGITWDTIDFWLDEICVKND